VLASRGRSERVRPTLPDLLPVAQIRELTAPHWRGRWDDLAGQTEAAYLRRAIAVASSSVRVLDCDYPVDVLLAGLPRTTTATATRRQGMNLVPIHATASATTSPATVYESSNVTSNGILLVLAG
jgi:hypothetical protein